MGNLYDKGFEVLLECVMKALSLQNRSTMKQTLLFIGLTLSDLFLNYEVGGTQGRTPLLTTISCLPIQRYWWLFDFLEILTLLHGKDFLSTIHSIPPP